MWIYFRILKAFYYRLKFGLIHKTGLSFKQKIKFLFMKYEDD